MKLFYLFISLFFFSTTQAQNSISGKITNTEGIAVPSATILLQTQQLKIIRSTISNSNGEFSFENIPDGKYELMISSVNYKTQKVIDVVPGEKSRTILLQTIDKALQSITVTSTRPFIEQKIDKLVVNVDASPSNAGATAMEVLEKSPGVTVDNDGNISLKGKQGVIVTMDGKQTYLSGADLANILKNLPASAIDQIEIMTNPSSKYDAAGNSGVINIKTKKTKIIGSNGSVSVGNTIGLFENNNKTEVMYKPTVTLNYNYKKDKFNFFGNAVYNYREGRSYLDVISNYYRNNLKIDSINHFNTLFRAKNNNYTLKLGLDYEHNKNNIFGIVVNGFLFEGRPRPLTQTVFTKLNGDVFSRLSSSTINKISWNNISTNFNYKHLFDSTGEITLDLDYSRYDNVSDQLLSTGFFDANYNPTADSIFLRGHLPSLINIFALKSDFSKSTRSGWKFETGIKSSYVSSDNVVIYERNAGFGWMPDSRNNHFVYKENINAAYVNMNKKFSKWSLQTGLRLENTITKGVQISDNTTVKRNYLSLFPSLFVSRPVNEKNTLTISASRRLQRPNYQDLNPFTFFLDSLSYKQGNPYLTPQFSYNFEITHTYNNKINTTFNYTKTEDVISQIINRKRGANDEIIGFLTTDNIASYSNIGLAVSSPVKYTKWWNGSIYINGYRNHYKGTYIDNESGIAEVVPLDLSFTSFTLNISNNFTITKTISGEISGWYRYKTIDQLSLAEPMAQINFGLAKNKLFKGKGTLRLSARDPFNWQRYKATTRYGTVDINMNNRWDNRQYGINFTYRFGKTQIQQRKRSSGSEEEQQRVGAGN